MRKILRKIGDYFGSGCRLAVLDLQKGRWIVEPAPRLIGYLKAENANGRHILMQPTDESRYLLADDLCLERICRNHRYAGGIWKPGRMVVETSPENYQVWIRTQRPLTLYEKRYWLKRMGSDPGADPKNRWGRCPGFRNRKERHLSARGRYHLAKLIWIDWVSEAQVPQIPLDAAVFEEPFSHQPLKGGVCHINNTCRSNYEMDGKSETDFSYALALFRMGHPEDEVRTRILSERTNWNNHRGDRRTDLYLDRTVRRAKAIIEQTRNRSK